MENIKWFLRKGYKGIEIWSVLASVGIPSMIRGIWDANFGDWPLYRQLLVFGGSIPVLLSVFPALLSRRRVKNDTKLSTATVSERKVTSTSDSQNILGQKYADWMTAALNRDTSNLSGTILVSDLRIDWTHLRDTDSYFLIHCKVYSSSVFNIEIGKVVDGHLRYKSKIEDAELERVPEIANSIQLERSVSQVLTIRQWVSQSMMNTIAFDGGSEITLVFSGVNISANAKYPDGSDGPKFRLPLSDEYQAQLATRSELESQ